MKKLVSFLAFIFLAASVFCFSGCSNSAAPAPNAEITEEIVRPQKSDFRIMLEEVIEDKSEKEGLTYIIDEESYNEKEISFYMKVMSDKLEAELTRDDIETYIHQAFSDNESNGVTYLVKKDNRDLIMECGSMKKHNVLDRTLMGIENDEVDKKSKGFYISQNNPEFLNTPYGTSTVGRSGCGPIALTMAINYVSGEEVTKLSDVTSWAIENDLYVSGSGTKWVLMSSYPPTVGVKSREVYTSDFETFKTLFKEGSVIVTSMKKGHFTDNGHFIVIIPEKDGKVSVLDPASITRTLEEWDTELIFSESKKCFFVISK